MKLHQGYGENAHKVIVSLCDYSGRWPSEYISQGYTVAQFDLKLGDDCTDVSRTLSDINEALLTANFEGRRFCAPEVDRAYVAGVLAAPVCTDFSVSGAQYWAKKDQDGTTAKSLLLVDSCKAIIDACSPDFWAIENPVGRLKTLRPQLPFVAWFQPHNFALLDASDESRYTKKTGLWGVLKMPDLTTHNAEPVRACAQGSWLQKLGGKSERTKELRSMTPLGFAVAFAQANP